MEASVYNLYIKDGRIIFEAYSSSKFRNLKKKKKRGKKNGKK
jgi:hypothetical protein